MAHIKQKCDFCNDPALYDTQTRMGPWANCCQAHFDKYSTKIKGLYSILEPAIIEKKQCSRCNKEKTLDEFYVYVDGKGVKRYRNECKQCNLEERKRIRMKKP